MIKEMVHWWNAGGPLLPFLLYESFSQGLPSFYSFLSSIRRTATGRFIDGACALPPLFFNFFFLSQP